MKDEAVNRHNSADSVPTSNFVCSKMASILNSQLRDLKHGSTLKKDCDVIILSMNYHAKLQDQVKSLVYKMLINKIDFHSVFEVIMKVVFSFFQWSLTR